MEDIDVILAEWRRERPDLPLGGMELFGLLGRIAALGGKAIGGVFEHHGLKTGEFDVLAALRRSGKPYKLTPTRLFQGLMLSSGAMTNRLDRLEQAGLIRREPDPSDRRGTLIVLTPQGLTLVEKAVRDHTANEERLIASLSDTERRKLSGLLRKLLAALEAQA